MTSWYAVDSRLSGLPESDPRSPGATSVAPLLLPLAAVTGVLLGVRLGSASVGAVALAVVGAFALVLVGWAAVRSARTTGATSVGVAVGVAAGVAIVASVSGAHSWREYHDVVTGPVDGVARVTSDPVDEGSAVHVVLEVDGERFDVWARGSPARRLRRVLAGDTVEVVGERIVPESRPWWWRPRHVVGRLDVESIGAMRPGPPAQEAANRVRRQLEHGARTLTVADRALFTGLVVGDDRSVDEARQTAFRNAGLSHLTAVSGQNVALLLAVASPVLRRLSPWWRWCTTIALIAWFALLTRFEPSVLRASAMAAVGATAFVTGRERAGVGVLAVALTGLVIVDPMLVWSVGFWLSAAATAGLAVFAVPFAAAIPGPSWWRTTLGSTLAAQIGVLPVAAAVFGVPSVIGVVANVLAVPVAGAVMVVGFPCAMAASVLPDTVASVVMLPCRLGVRWVAGVAHVLAGAAPPPGLNVVLWAVALGGVGWSALRRRGR